MSAASPALSHFFLLTPQSLGGGAVGSRFRKGGGGGGAQGEYLMHSKQLKHFKPLNPDSSREQERVGELDREGCDEEERRGVAEESGESLFPTGR